MPGFVRRREGAASNGKDAVRPTELSSTRRTHQPHGPRHEGDAHHRAVPIRGSHAVRLARPAFPGRAVESSAGADAGGHSPIRRRLQRIRGAHRTGSTGVAQLKRESPGWTGRPSTPRRSKFNHARCGILDAPPARSMTRARTTVIARLDLMIQYAAPVELH